MTLRKEIEEIAKLIKELKGMITKSESPQMDNSHILDTRKADKMLTKIYLLIKGFYGRRNSHE